MTAFARTRRVVFGIVLASFVLSFFHRTAPAAIARELAQSFAIGGAVLGTLAATYFYVYTLLQIPVGVLADTWGPRRLLSAGALVAAVGSLAFAIAPTWQVAALGRTLVGVGVATAFISILKISAVWFPANRFATLNGVTLFAGNLGAVVAGAPLAWAVSFTSWRVVFVVLAALSLLLAAMTWWKVRDRPEDLGFAAVHPMPAAAAADRVGWKAALAGVLRNPATWPPFVVNVGVGGSYLAFAGLWSVPYLIDVHSMTRVEAAQHASVLLLGVAVGAVAVGLISDRLRNRRAVMRAYTTLYALSWLPWLVHAPLRGRRDIRVVRADGVADSRLHAVVDDREGSEPARAFGHRDVGRERRHLPRHRRAATACRLRARPGARDGQRRRRLGRPAMAAGRRRGARSACRVDGAPAGPVTSKGVACQSRRTPVSTTRPSGNVSSPNAALRSASMPLSRRMRRASSASNDTLR